MQEILTIIIIAVALSMDAFSMALGIGTRNISKKKSLFLAATIGIFHFFMPIIGILLGAKIVHVLHWSEHLLFSIILIFLAIQMLLEARKEEESNQKLTFFNIYLISFGVSIDSFTVGIGLSSFTSNIFLATTIFTIFSAVFTYMGLIVGKYASKLLGNYATYFGAGILILLALIHIM